VDERFGLAEVFLFRFHFFDGHIGPITSLVLQAQSHDGLVARFSTEFLKVWYLALLPVGAPEPSGVQFQLVDGALKRIATLQLFDAAGQGEPSANMDSKAKSDVVRRLAGRRISYA